MMKPPRNRIRVVSQTSVLVLLTFIYISIHQQWSFMLMTNRSPTTIDDASSGVPVLSVISQKVLLGSGGQKRISLSQPPPSPPVLLNPFRDVTLLPFHVNDGSRHNYYSSYQCVSAVGSNDHPDEVRFLSRTCKFTNLYYTPHDATFHYYPSPAEVSLYRNNETAILILQEEMSISLGHVLQKDSKSIDTVPPFTKWNPVVHINDSSPPSNFAKIANPENPLFLLYHPFYSFNFGHFIWDDLLGLFSMMDMFSMNDIGGRGGDDNLLSQQSKEKQIIPLMVEFAGQDSYHRCQAQLKRINMYGRWDQCTKMYQKMFPPLLRIETHSTGDILRTNTWLRGMDNVGYWSSVKSARNTSTNNEEEKDWNKMIPNMSHVLIPTALAGMGRLGQMSCTADCTIGRASQLASFRDFLMRNVFWKDYETMVKHHDPAGYITFSLPFGSSRPTAVTFFEDIIPVAKQLYGHDKVKVVNFTNMTVRDQALLAMDTAVLFSYHGGGSATSVFLPKHASILLHSTVGKCSDKMDRGYVWCDRGRNHFDSVFYTSDSYIRTVWVNPEDRGNVSRLRTLLELEYEKTMRAWGRQPPDSA